jgi:hypothetical protein
VRALVADGRARLRESTGDPGQFWPESALGRLTTVDDDLLLAAGDLGGWTRTLIATPIMLAVAAVAALVTGELGFSTFWIVACSWAGAVLVEFPVRRRLGKLGPELGRRRLDRAASIASSRPRDLADLPEALVRARVRLVSVALREAGSKHWDAPYLARAAAREPTLFRLAEADMMLCQAIDFLEIYLAADTKEPT